MRAFRASWLGAVTNFVWSTIPKRLSMADLLTPWRTVTMSLSVRIIKVSVLRMSKVMLLGKHVFLRTPRPYRRAQELHAALDVECRWNAFERKAELDERDGDRGLHPDD